uniref:WRKY19-like zinc finger domain-containing protein n=1 Tax=Timema douglasi TaxID=61478 RepID=A0A7R8VQ43_TIMDO|nr:unnamed protein product [Timema douglasi]
MTQVKSSSIDGLNNPINNEIQHHSSISNKIALSSCPQIKQEISEEADLVEDVNNQVQFYDPCVGTMRTIPNVFTSKDKPKFLVRTLISHCSVFSTYPDTLLLSFSTYPVTSLLSFSTYPVTSLLSFSTYPDTALLSFSTYPDTPLLLSFSTYPDTSLLSFSTYPDTPLLSFYTYPDTPLLNFSTYPDTPLLSFSIYPHTPLLSFSIYPHTLLLSFSIYPDTPLLSFSIYPDTPLLSFSIYPDTPLLSFSIYPDTPLLSFSIYPDTPLLSFSIYPDTPLLSFPLSPMPRCSVFTLSPMPRCSVFTLTLISRCLVFYLPLSAAIYAEQSNQEQYTLYDTNLGQNWEKKFTRLTGHGGIGPKCKAADCPKSALKGGFCMSHGGIGRICKVEGCLKNVGLQNDGRPLQVGYSSSQISTRSCYTLNFPVITLCLLTPHGCHAISATVSKTEFVSRNQSGALIGATASKTEFVSRNQSGALIGELYGLMSLGGASENDIHPRPQNFLLSVSNPHMACLVCSWSELDLRMGGPKAVFHTLRENVGTFPINADNPYVLPERIRVTHIVIAGDVVEWRHGCDIARNDYVIGKTQVDKVKDITVSRNTGIVTLERRSGGGEEISTCAVAGGKERNRQPIREQGP